MNWARAIFGVLIGAAIGSLVEGVEGHAKMVTFYTFAGLAAVFGIAIAIGWLSTKWWPSKLNWEFSTERHAKNSEFQEQVFSKGIQSVNWKSMTPQVEGMFYQLDMKKERVISGVWFNHGLSNNVPEEWELTFLRELGGYANPNKTTKEIFIRGKDSILVQELERPVKVRLIQARIRKPRQRDDGSNYFWLIGDIVLRENRIFGRWCRRIIK